MAQIEAALAREAPQILAAEEAEPGGFGLDAAEYRFSWHAEGRFAGVTRLEAVAWIGSAFLHLLLAAAVVLFEYMHTSPSPLAAIDVAVVFETPAPSAPQPAVTKPVADPGAVTAAVASPPNSRQDAGQAVPEPAAAETESIAPASVEQTAAPPPVEATEPPAVAAAEPPTLPEPPLPLPRPKPRPPIAPRSAPLRAPMAAPQQVSVSAAPAQAAAAPIAQISPVGAPAQEAALPVLPPRPLAAAAGNRKPDYPGQARRRGLQGRVLLRVDVSQDGRATGVSVAESSGHPVLDEAAVAAVRTWRFVPATRGGETVPGLAVVPILFRLEN